MFIYKQTEFFSKDGADLWTVGHMEWEKFIPESDHGRKEDAVERVKELNGGGSGYLVRPDGRINRGRPSAKRINLMRAKAQVAYEEGGQSEVYKLNEHELKLPYRHCEPCETDTPDLYGECLVCGSKYQAQANARLIAAAPELLEALKEVLAFEKRGADKGEPRIGTGILNIIHRAIAKAEGRDVV